MLYIVPTPIGNLDDLTFRALKILQEVSIILCEDTRTSSVLLKHYDIHTPLKSYHQYNEHEMVDSLITQLATGIDMALISDAGTPAISDPGFLLVRACIEHDIHVQCLPGATACIPALVESGFPINSFTFYGFLPPKKGRNTFLQTLANEEKTFVLYEAPFKLLHTLQDLCKTLGDDRQVCVCRELSKVHEEAIRGTLAELVDYFTTTPPKGEIVIVIKNKKM